jgi:hypothetical protein
MTKLITLSFLDGQTLHKLVMKLKTFGRAEGWRDVVVKMLERCAAEWSVWRRSCVLESSGKCAGCLVAERRGSWDEPTSESLSEGSSSTHETGCFRFADVGDGSSEPGRRESIKAVRKLTYMDRVATLAFARRGGPNASRFASRCIRDNWFEERDEMISERSRLARAANGRWEDR